mmetsp:Transcript_25100/g.35156  ORF Transcript_25100/g.35156 Transcript_25100/m.35156 type:complete len:281 (-) Transcript_25100:471-1313(-)
MIPTATLRTIMGCPNCFKYSSYSCLNSSSTIMDHSPDKSTSGCETAQRSPTGMSTTSSETATLLSTVSLLAVVVVGLSNTTVLVADATAMGGVTVAISGVGSDSAVVVMDEEEMLLCVAALTAASTAVPTICSKLLDVSACVVKGTEDCCKVVATSSMVLIVSCFKLLMGSVIISKLCLMFCWNDSSCSLATADTALPRSTVLSVLVVLVVVSSVTENAVAASTTSASLTLVSLEIVLNFRNLRIGKETIRIIPFNAFRNCLTTLRLLVVVTFAVMDAWL